MLRLTQSPALARHAAWVHWPSCAAFFIHTVLYCTKGSNQSIYSKLLLSNRHSEEARTAGPAWLLLEQFGLLLHHHLASRLESGWQEPPHPPCPRSNSITLAACSTLTTPAAALSFFLVQFFALAKESWAVPVHQQHCARHTRRAERA